MVIRTSSPVARPAQEVPANSIVREALEIQAANRPPKGPPKAISVTPPLPKAGKIRRRRRRTV